MQAVERALGRAVLGSSPLGGGCVAHVERVRTRSGPDVVVKTGGTAFEVEAFMLRYLKAHSDLPVPGVLHDEPGMLVLEFLPGSNRRDEAAEAHGADLLAALHARAAERFGFERDTVIGPLPQANPWTGSWREFFAAHRLRAMTEMALGAGQIRGTTASRLGRLADSCARLLREPERPALLHGDVWSGNILAQDGRITGFLDPSIYYGHPEIELAFVTLFGTFEDAFFARYAARRRIEPGFEARAKVYNLYPLLVHARLFGGAYPGMIERTLSELGF